MPRGARIAGWVYFPIHAVVLPLTIGALLMAVLGKLPSDVTCNVLYYLCGLVFTLIAMWRFLRRSFDTMVGSILRCIGMMLAAYGIDVLLSLVLQLGTSLIGELPVPNNDTVTGLAKVDYKRMIAVAVLMAPLVEECLFRGVVFGTIRPRSRFGPMPRRSRSSRSTTSGSMSSCTVIRSCCSRRWRMCRCRPRSRSAMSRRARSGRRCFSTCLSTRSRSRCSPGEGKKKPPLSGIGKQRLFYAFYSFTFSYTQN